MGIQSMVSGQFVATRIHPRRRCSDMYPVTHMTIAAGGVWLGAQLWRKLRARSATESIDYRFVALGSQIPDAIDKPLARAGMEAFSYDVTSGHSIGHTLLVSASLIAIGALIAQRGDRRALWLGLGSLTHLVVDPVIAYPRILFWPALGKDFPHSHGIPSAYLIAGDIALASAFAYLIWHSEEWRERFKRFALRGQFPLEEARPTHSR